MPQPGLLAGSNTAGDDHRVVAAWRSSATGVVARSRVWIPIIALCTLILAACNGAAATGPSSDALGQDVVAAAPDPCRDAGTDAATATCLQPTRDPAYYVAQAEAYFDTLDIDADPNSVPVYADLVARWEWPPWLLLTGYGRDVMVSTGKLLKKGDPSTVPTRDCRAFTTQPFARCRVVFSYKGGPCPIYEEFTFNEAGEMTFIEAWSDLPTLVPTQDPSDLWGERSPIGRLSTRIPGLGKTDGRIDLDGAAMATAAANDPDVADFVKRAKDFWPTWTQQLADAPTGFFAMGCGWARE